MDILVDASIRPHGTDLDAGLSYGTSTEQRWLWIRNGDELADGLEELVVMGSGLLVTAVA